MDQNNRKFTQMRINTPPKKENSSSPHHISEIQPELVRAASLAAASGAPLVATQTLRTKSSAVGGMVEARSSSFSLSENDSPKTIMKNHEHSLTEDRQRRRFSLSTLWSLASEHDMEIDDELTQKQKKLKDLKMKISTQSKRNFLLERDVRYLDSRIALLIQNRMALDFEAILNEDDRSGDAIDMGNFLDDRKKQLCGNLFFLLQTEPRIVAHLTHLITLSEIDTLLQTVMFTLYGNQYDSREEHLLLTMFQTVLKVQFDSTSDFGSLLRANTPVSRMMTTYTRRGPGQQYLKYVLTRNINSVIVDENLNLEINPVKIYEQMLNDQESSTGKTSNLPRTVTADEAIEHPEVEAILKPRMEGLITIANLFLNTIIESIDQVPYGIRWICKQIKTLTRKKFPEASDWSICSLIGGFFFLRFVNPAIVTPQSYMIIDGQPSKNPRRTLTLIAKMLQNLANKPSYAKEEYMMSLNSFVDDNKEKISHFLYRLCEVEDFYESLELDQYMAMSKKDISISISLNEIYNTHSLLYQHINEICSYESNSPESSRAAEQSYKASCTHLKSLLGDLGAAPAQLSRSDNKTINLALFSKWESAPILFPEMVEYKRKELEKKAGGHVTEELTDADILFMDTKTLIVQVMRKQALLGSSAIHTNHIYVPPITVDHVPNSKFNLISIEEVLDKGANLFKDPSTVKRSLRARQNLRILEERYRHPFIKFANNYRQLADEVYAEFLHLNSLKTKVVHEIQSLELVYKTICDHNQYLRGQLESYRAYLQNVRIQASASGNTNGVMLGVTSGQSSSTKQSITRRATFKKGNAVSGPMKFTHYQLEKDGVIVESGVPENRRSNIYFSIESPVPGSFMIGLHYKGRDKPIVEVDVKLDDLLEKQQDNIQHLDLEYVQLNVNKMLYMLNKHFIRR